MHCPQNVLAETELRHLAAIPYQIVSPSSNSPIIGIYQDSLLGAYQFTRPNINFSPRDAMNLLMMYSNVDTKALRDSGSRISSFDILSQIMKPITLKYNTKLYNDKDEDPTISNNVFVTENGFVVKWKNRYLVLLPKVFYTEFSTIMGSWPVRISSTIFKTSSQNI